MKARGSLKICRKKSDLHYYNCLPRRAENFSWLKANIRLHLKQRRLLLRSVILIFYQLDTHPIFHTSAAINRTLAGKNCMYILNFEFWLSSQCALFNSGLKSTSAVELWPVFFCKVCHGNASLKILWMLCLLLSQEICSFSRAMLHVSMHATCLQGAVFKLKKPLASRWK